MTGYLPRGTQVGDKLRLCPYALNHNTGQEMAPQAMTGEVVYVHPHRRFATVCFPLEGYESCGHKVDKSFQECWLLEPDARRLAHKDVEDVQDGRPAGSRGKPDCPPLTVRLQGRDWSDMTSGQIAAVLGCSQHSVTTAIYQLAKRGINIPYIRRGVGAPKAAAGSSSSDSGKGK